MTIRFFLATITDQVRECPDHQSDSCKNYKKYPRDALQRFAALFEQGSTMVWRAVRSVLVEKAKNYIGLGALAGIHVHLSQELQWFGEP